MPRHRSVHADEYAGILAARRCEALHTWAEIGRHFGTTGTAVRGRYLHTKDRDSVATGPCPLCLADSASPAGEQANPGEDSSGTTFAENGNYAEAYSTTDRIQTLDQLLDACKVDLAVWRVLDWGIKKWDVGAKVKKGQLTWNQGVIDGHLSYQGLGVQDLWSVWARFVRIEPRPIHPVIRPIECPALDSPSPDARPSSGRALILADPQFGFQVRRLGGRLEPFHDRQALDCALQIAEAEALTDIVWLGDIEDLALFTDRFVRSPEFESTTQPAILETHWWLKQYRAAAPSARFRVHEGNHDERMREALAVHLRAAYALRPADELEMPEVLSVPRLLGLAGLGIEWAGGYPDDETWLTEDLRLCHGNVANSAPGATARHVVESSDVSTIFGHIHRRESISRTLYAREGTRVIVAHCPGCVCRIDGAVPGSTARQNWQQGVAIVDYSPDGFSIYDVPIRDGRALWAGRVYTARDRVPDLRRDLAEWNW